MLNNFIYAKQKSLFEEALNNGEVLDEAIVFIEDTKEIWNHGTYFAESLVIMLDVLFDYLQSDVTDSVIPLELYDVMYDAVNNNKIAMINHVIATVFSVENGIIYILIDNHLETIELRIHPDLTLTPAVNPKPLLLVLRDGTKFLSDSGEYKKITVPTSTSQLTNDSDFATKTEVSNALTSAQEYTNSAVANLNTFMNFYEGSNTAGSIAALPVTKRLCIATISTSASLGLSTTPDAGREIHIIINNSSTSEISIALPNTGSYVCLSDTALTISAGGYAEVNIISDGSKMYIRSL